MKIIKNPGQSILLYQKYLMGGQLGHELQGSKYRPSFNQKIQRSREIQSDKYYANASE